MKIELAWCPSEECGWIVAAPYGDNAEPVPQKCPRCGQWTTVRYT